MVPTKNTAPKCDINVYGDNCYRRWWGVWIVEIQDANEDEQERDRIAFTNEERDTIIKAFYDSEKVNECHAAPLIEFVSLTGCRPGEAFALRWQDVMLERGYIRFSKSYNGNLKNTDRI